MPLYILVLGVSVCYVQQCCVYGRLGCGECWQTAVVLIPVTLYVLVFGVSVGYIQQCCFYARLGCGECWQTVFVLNSCDTV